MKFRLVAAGIALLLGGMTAGHAAAAATDAPELAFPLACEVGRTCEIQNYVDRDPGPGVRDYRCNGRTYAAHNGVDIRLADLAVQRAGVAVLAAAAGRVARVRDGVPDVSVRTRGEAAVAGQECGNGVVIDHGAGWETQYCHMAQGSVRVKPGDMVVTGTPIGRVGLSGLTEYPHLHVTVRHGGQVVDPFAPTGSESCAAQSSLWSADAARRLAYKAGAILNAGFAAGPVDMAALEAGGIAPPRTDSPFVVAYGRAIGLAAGDVLELVLTAPTGKVLARQLGEAAPRDQAQRFLMVGRRRPAAGWPSGRYAATFRVLRAGKTVASRDFAVGL